MTPPLRSPAALVAIGKQKPVHRQLAAFLRTSLPLALIAGLSLNQTARGETLTWTGASGNWADGATGNWAGGAVWTNGDSAVFSGHSEATVSIGGSVVVGDLDASNNLYTFAAVGTSSLTVQGTGTSMLSGLSDSPLFSDTLSLIKSGSGELLLGGSNFSGGTTLHAGTLGLGSDFALGSGSLTI
jgi:autotransporter-associated beta strand protein